MKIKIICSLGLLLLVSSVGCKTAAPADTLQRIQTACKAAAYIGTAEYLETHPDAKNQFTAVATELEILAAQDTIDYVTILAVVNHLPIKELKSGNARIAITAATILLSDYAGSLPVGTAGTLKPVAASLAAGIRLGLL